jgi:serine/threonine-protein kinase HipA
MPDATVDVTVAVGDQDLLAGRLWTHRRGRSESATFAYSSDYIAHALAYSLDPALPLVAGQHQTRLGQALFGAFSDCAPDRWGRRLVDRSEEHEARDEHRTRRSFGEGDYLLRVRDDLRQGALRFRDPDEGVYVAQERSGVPHLLQLSKLLSASEHLERDEATAEELRVLLRGGSSLGGARPKAHVIAPDGRLAIAKFPSPAADEWDVMRWEYVAMLLARDAGIAVPDSTLQVIDGKPVHVIDRFDRAGDRRLGYVSAMTMLEAADGGTGDYLDIAAIVEEQSPFATRDLAELWTRIAFSILIRNTDDHLRNHGFLRDTSAGWSLSPAFDLNPNPKAGNNQLSTAIDGTTDARIDVALDVASVFRLSDGAARQRLGQVASATKRWRTVATASGLAESAIESMAIAFEHTESERVAKLTALPA